VRLSTCIALEVFCAGALTCGVWAGARHGLAEISKSIGWAEASEARAPRPPSVDTEAGVLGDVDTVGVFDGVSDEVLLEPLRTGAITSIKFNRGGSSISLRVDFDNGSRAAFKPRQTNLHSIPRYEVAAFRVNRLLGLSSVAPALGREFAVDAIMSALRPDSRVFAPRMTEEMVSSDGKVIGELSRWIPVIEPAKIEGYLIDSTDGVLTWTRYLRAGAPIPAPEWNLVAQISDMVVFDFVIDNADRFSGRNVWVSGDGRVLYFMDNTLSFGGGSRGSFKSRAYLSKVQKFSRAMVSGLRRLSVDTLGEATGRDLGPFDVILTGDEIANVIGRRDFAIGYIDGLIDQHGAENVLVFP
jgi:hypothetical protein